VEKSKKQHVYRSMEEVAKKFFPKTWEKRQAERPEDAEALGISLAKESLNKIREQLTK